MQLKYSLFIILFSLILAACSDQEPEPVPDAGVFRPPTQAPTRLPTAEPVLEQGERSVADEPRPSPTPSCTNGLWFLADLTIPDGALVQPGQRLDKRWEVKNSGTCNWDERYQVRLIAGPGMGVPVQQALIPALSGTKTMIRMVFIAPEEPGNHRSAWQAYDPQENAFGDPFFIDILVEAPEEVEATLSPENAETDGGN